MRFKDFFVAKVAIHLLIALVDVLVDYGEICIHLTQRFHNGSAVWGVLE